MVIKVCIILITFAILIGVGFYCWDILERNQKSSMDLDINL